MSVPTIVSVTPNSGPATGRNLVVITGTNFRVPTPVAATGPVGAALLPSVRVTFDGAVPRTVDVISATEIDVEMAAYQGDPRAFPIAASQLVVVNIDDAGDPISGESATLDDAYSYARPATLPPDATYDQQQYAWITRHVLRTFRRQVHQNTFHARASADYADASVEVVHDAPMPNITLSGPVILNDPWRENQHQYAVEGAGGTFDNFYPATTRLLRFSLRAESNDPAEALAIQQAVEELFQKNGYLFVDRSPGAPAEGQDQLDFVLTVPPALQPGSELDLHLVTATFEVRGVDLRYRYAYSRSAEIETFELQTQQGVARQEDDLPGTEDVPF